MSQPKLGKYPAEIFGYSYTDTSPQAKSAQDKQFCPFLQSECKKPRKSEPHIKIGICSVGYAGTTSPDGRHLPVIICPHRLDLSVIHETIETKFFKPLKTGEKILWAKEVSIGGAGSVDFVGIKVDSTNAVVSPVDFVCVELQAAGTTGTPWEAIQDFRQHGEFKKNSYDFGINWANEFIKTMMQQVYKKGMVITSWKRKIVFAIQDVGLSYIQENCDASSLRAFNEDDPIHLCTFKMVWDDVGKKWILRHDKILSTDTEGVRKILAGAHSDEFITVERFIENIQQKLQ